MSLLVVTEPSGRGADAPKMLRIGASGGILFGGSKEKEKGAIDSLKEFIKDETGLNNEIITQKDWKELTEKMMSKELQIGVYQGYEFAWAQTDHTSLKPLVLCVNGSRYPIAYVVASKSLKIPDFAALKGQTLALPDTSRGLSSLFLGRLCQAQGKKPEEFFTKITKPESIEDALDDVVDGNVTATVLDRTALDAYKRRKPGRFQKLAEVSHSEAVLPPIIAYVDGALDKTTLDKFRNGLLKANQQERGQTLLTLFRLTGFDDVPKDFDQVAERTRKAFPSEDKAKK
jgi:ABC-type phosphate/phosphonate transport system substrate-binding protein